MGRFAKYLGDTEIEIDGEKLALKAKVVDQQRLINLREHKGEQLVETVNLLTDLLVRSYPEEPKEELEAFATTHAMVIIKKLSVAWGWISSEEEFDKNIEKAVEDPLGNPSVKKEG